MLFNKYWNQTLCKTFASHKLIKQPWANCLQRTCLGSLRRRRFAEHLPFAALSTRGHCALWLLVAVVQPALSQCTCRDCTGTWGMLQDSKPCQTDAYKGIQHCSGRQIRHCLQLIPALRRQEWNISLIPTSSRVSANTFEGTKSRFQDYMLACMFI